MVECLFDMQQDNSCQRDDRRLDVFTVTETWHHSSEDITLRLSAPSDYTTADAIHAHDPGHGGIVVFYRKRFTCSRLTLPALSTFEGLCLRLSADGESFILLTVYRPGSTRTSSLFYDELSTVLESLVLQSNTVIVGDDFNIHVQDATDADTQRLMSVFDSFDLHQHVAVPTHCLGGTLDLLAPFASYGIADLTVGPAGVISDHSLITCSLPSRRQMKTAPERTICSWCSVDWQAFVQAIKDSTPSSSSTAEELFAEYDCSS